MKKTLFLLPLLLAACGGSNGGQPQSPTAANGSVGCTLNVDKLLQEAGQADRELVWVKSHCIVNGGEHTTTKHLELKDGQELELCFTAKNNYSKDVPHVRIGHSISSDVELQRPAAYGGKLVKFIFDGKMTFLDTNDDALILEYAFENGKKVLKRYEILIDALPAGKSASVCVVHKYKF